MRKNNFYLYDDLRLIGKYKTLKEVYETGEIKVGKTYFYKKHAETGFFEDDNIYVFRMTDRSARVEYYGKMIAKRARLCPDIGGLEPMLKDILNKMMGQEL